MLKTLTMLLLAALLGGCAAMNQVSSEVSTFGNWPAGTTQPSFVFDRLPSQPAETQNALEDAALPALRSAGFRPAADPSQADYVVQLGASISADPRYVDELDFRSRFGWAGGWHYRRYGFGPGWGFNAFPGGPIGPMYQREVVVMVRDRRSGQTVYETRASNSSNSPLINYLLPAMFQAALADFPNPAGSRRNVVTPIGR
ncbi:MAG: DUF4136 domain-containing protein [Ideonella sp.]